MRPKKLHLALGVCVLVGVACSLDRLGTGLPTGSLDGGGGTADGVAPIPDTGPRPDVVVVTDAGQDAVVEDVVVPDAGMDVTTGDPFPYNVVVDASTVGDLGDPTTLDTDGLTINGAAPPAGVVFTRVAASPFPYAVLVVGGMTVSTGLTITGTHALVVVARSDVTISAPIQAAATATGPGPGGGWNTVVFPTVGPDGGTNGGPTNGRGNPGATSGGNRGGGGGAGHGTAGSKGGNTTFGAGGLAYTGPAPLLGGSHGGAGTGPNLTIGCGHGGSGGGAVQISSYGKITITSGGVIDVGGAAGQGGCDNNSGPGGGSGGTILLEAQQGLFVQGVLAANGGGGGGGGQGGGIYGTIGENGGQTTTPALGGAPGGSAGAGGNGGAGATGPGLPGDGGTRGGGGGGAYGQVLFRYRAVLDGGLVIAPGAIVTPGATILPNVK